MAPNDEVLVDELRFGRMFQRLQRAGMFRRCGCAGCAPCAESAQRLLSGVAQGGRFSGYYRPERWGDRYRVYERPTHSGTVSVLTDMAQQPTVVDVNVSAGPPDGGEENETLSDLLLKRLPASAPPDWKQQFSQLLGKYPFVFTTVKSPAAAPASSGLYIIQWRNGQYLGEAQNLSERLAQHQTDMRRHGVNPATRKLYVAPVIDHLAQERKILLDVATLAGKLTGKPVGKRTYVDLFRTVGMTNQRTELEWF